MPKAVTKAFIKGIRDERIYETLVGNSKLDRSVIKEVLDEAIRVDDLHKERNRDKKMRGGTIRKASQTLRRG